MTAVRIPLLLCLCLLASIALAAQRGAADWLPTPEQPVGWRGDGTGVFPGATPPTSWNGIEGTNITWKADLPWWGSCSPIVVGDRVFVSVEPGALLCYGADDGKLRWHAWHDSLMAQFDAVKADQLRTEWATLMATRWIDRPKDDDVKQRMKQ